MNCRTAVERIDEQLDGLLPPAEAEEMRSHVAECEACTREMRAAEKFRGFLAGSGHEAIESAAARRIAEHAVKEALRTGDATPRGRRFVLRAAAVAAVVVAGVAGWSLAPDAETGVQLLAEGSPTHLARGAERLAAPGRTVRVDEDALLAAVPGSRGERVRLDAGSALFHVERGRPFEVETPQGDVSVAGTLFHVEVRSDRSVSVAVLSGVVRFEPRGFLARRTLRAGTILDVDPEGRHRLVSRTQTNDLETRVEMQGMELDALRGEVLRLEEALAESEAPLASPEPPVPVNVADSAGLPWHELGVAACRLLRAREGFDDPDSLVALSVFYLHAPVLKRVTGCADPLEWPLHPIVLSRAATSFFAALAPEASQDARAEVAAIAAEAGADLAARLGADTTPTEALAEKLRFFRTFVEATRARLGDAAAATIAQALQRSRDGAPVRVIPVGNDPAEEIAREWGKSFGFDAEQAVAAIPAVRRYVDSAFAAQETVLAVLGTTEAEPLLFPEFRPWRIRPALAGPAEPDAEVVERTLRRIEAKFTLARPRIELEREIAALLRDDQRKKGFSGGSLGWGLPTLRTHE